MSGGGEPLDQYVIAYLCVNLQTKFGNYEQFNVLEQRGTLHSAKLH